MALTLHAPDESGTRWVRSNQTCASPSKYLLTSVWFKVKAKVLAGTKKAPQDLSATSLCSSYKNVLPLCLTHLACFLVRTLAYRVPSTWNISSYPNGLSLSSFLLIFSQAELQRSLPRPHFQSCSPQMHFLLIFYTLFSSQPSSVILLHSVQFTHDGRLFH